jgi:uncharacterized repeat protein (TIGR03803 family)
VLPARDGRFNLDAAHRAATLPPGSSAGTGRRDGRTAQPQIHSVIGGIEDGGLSEPLHSSNERRCTIARSVRWVAAFDRRAGRMPQALALAARTHSPSYKVLHSFSGLGDGYYPAAGLIDVNGTLYGTTTSGGAYRNGTVFSITPDGKEKVLHSFGKGADGVYPRAGLIDVGGRLYGTTFYGGGSPDSCDDFYHGCGTVFSVTTGGSEKVLHSFNHPKVEGSSPGGLIDVGGTLYGATGSGGPYDGGTIFSMTMRGTEKVLHSFGHGNDGYAPNGALIDVGGTLYGTTFNGGRYDNAGTIFRITTGGPEKVLHSFGKGTDGDEVVSSSDGYYPLAALIDGRRHALRDDV